MGNDNNVKNNDETLIFKLNKAQEELPGLVLPSMGIIKNDDKVVIYGKDYIKSRVVKED